MKTLCQLAKKFIVAVVMAVAVGTAYSQTVSVSPATLTFDWSNTVNIAGVGTSWTPGTPGTPTFTVSGTGCALASQVVQSTTAATVKLTVGSVDCTITDPSSGATTVVSVPRAVQNWYVRVDGGPRFSSNNTSGTCDGTADSAPVGSTPNQHCAFNDMRYMWQDGSTFSYFNIGWLTSGFLGGDTVILRGSIADGVSYRIGWASTTGDCDTSGFPCFGFAGDSSDSGMPPIPSGSSVHKTRILGGNAGSCLAPSARTQVHGGYGGVSYVMNTSGASNLDIQCIDVTDFAACGQSAQNPGCTTAEDFAAYGIKINNQMDHLTITDVTMHGLAVAGMLGPTADATVFTDIAWKGNAGAGWNADDGTVGSGHLLVQNYEITGNGCVEQYPIVDAFPYIKCTDQAADTHGGLGQGYGDGFGTTTAGGLVPWFIDFEDGLVRYNTQDGIDALHAQGAGSSTTVNRTLAYGSEGNQLKVGSDGGTFMTNNQIFANCDAMKSQITGFPAPVVFTATSTAPTSFTGTVTFGSDTITGVSSTAGLFVGQPLASLTSGAPDFRYFIEGTVITGISGSTITMSRVASDSSTGAVTIYGTHNTLTGVTNIGALSVGMPVSNPGSVWPTTITAIDVDADTITIAYGPYASATGATTTSAFNTWLSGWCRAGDEAVIVSLHDGGRSVFAGNTIYGERDGNTEESQGDLGGIVCSADSCGATSLITYADNVLLGFDPQETGRFPAQYFLQEGPFATNPFTNAGSIYSNNLQFHTDNSCPDPGDTDTICAEPDVVDTTWHAFGVTDVHPSSGSANIVGTGIAVTGMSTDFTGGSRLDPTTRGALEFSPGAEVAEAPTASPVAGSYTSVKIVTLSTVSFGPSIVYTTDGTDPTVTSLTCTITNGTLYAGPITVSTTQTIKAIGCESSFTSSSVFSALYTITLPPVLPRFMMNGTGFINGTFFTN